MTEAFEMPSGYNAILTSSVVLGTFFVLKVSPFYLKNNHFTKVTLGNFPLLKNPF